MNTTQTTETAATSKNAVQVYRAQTSSLQDQIRKLECEIQTARERFVGEKIAEGWKQFEYFSSYYGSHGELGEGNLETTFLFHPSVDISTWEGVTFSHGHFSQCENTKRFDVWLSGIPDGHIIEV